MVSCLSSSYSVQLKPRNAMVIAGKIGVNFSSLMQNPSRHVTVGTVTAKTGPSYRALVRTVHA